MTHIRGFEWDDASSGLLHGWAIALRILSAILVEYGLEVLCADPAMAPRLPFLPCSQSKLPAPWRQLGLLTRSLHAQAGCRPGTLQPQLQHYESWKGSRDSDCSTAKLEPVTVLGGKLFRACFPRPDSVASQKCSSTHCRQLHKHHPEKGQRKSCMLMKYDVAHGLVWKPSHLSWRFSLIH